MNEWVKEKEGRVVAKLMNNDGSFKQSVIIPTVMYPLNNNACRVFTSDNTKQIEDKGVLRIVDKIPFYIGRCYHNTAQVVTRLREYGYNIKSYVGWLFVCETQLPVHHCWAVLNDNEIIDLADDFTALYEEKNKPKWENEKDSREIIVSFQKAARGMKNSARCYPMGQATEGLVYVGCECDPEQGRLIYRQLIKNFPRHDCQRNCNADGYNLTQQLFKERGLM